MIRIGTIKLVLTTIDGGLPMFGDPSQDQFLRNMKGRIVVAEEVLDQHRHPLGDRMMSMLETATTVTTVATAATEERGHILIRQVRGLHHERGGEVHTWQTEQGMIFGAMETRTTMTNGGGMKI